MHSMFIAALFTIAKTWNQSKQSKSVHQQMNGYRRCDYLYMCVYIYIYIHTHTYIYNGIVKMKIAKPLKRTK